MMNSKVFAEYNHYHDRGIVKWQTAFALGELVSAIDKSAKQASREPKRLPQQNQEIIEQLLERSIKENKMLDVQLNTLDELGRSKEPITGIFRGKVTSDRVQIGTDYIEFCEIRHLKIYSFHKWSDVSRDKNGMEEVEIQEGTEYLDDDFWVE